MKGERLNTLVREAQRNNLSGDRISELMVEISGASYWLAEEVSELYKASMNDEAALENALVLAELNLIGKEGMAISKAHQAAKKEENVVEARTTYIESKAEYERWRGRLKGIERLLSALQMRLAWLKQEKAQSNTINRP